MISSIMSIEIRQYTCARRLRSATMVRHSTSGAAARVSSDKVPTASPITTSLYKTASRAISFAPLLVR
jgi:hypothetical protein